MSTKPLSELVADALEAQAHYTIRVVNVSATMSMDAKERATEADRRLTAAIDAVRAYKPSDEATIAEKA